MAEENIGFEDELLPPPPKRKSVNNGDGLLPPPPIKKKTSSTTGISSVIGSENPLNPANIRNNNGFDLSTAQVPDQLANLPSVDSYVPQPIFTPKPTLGNAKSNPLMGTNSFTEDINANLEGNRTTSQQRSLTQANRAFNEAQGEGTSEAIQEAVGQRPIDTLNGVDNLPYTGIGNNLAVGLNRAYEGLAKIPRFLYGAAAIPQNFLAEKLDMPSLGAKYEDFLQLTNTPAGTSPLTALDQLGNYYGKQAEDYKEKTQKYDDNIIGSISKGGFKQAGSQILDQIVESAPSIAMMAMTSGASNTANLGQVSKTLANALPFMSQRNAELQDDPTVPEYIKPINAALNGLSEVIFDQSFGTQAAIQGIVNRFQNEGRQAAVNAAKELTGSFLNGALKTAKAVKPFVNGAIEEASTQLAQNIVDKFTVNPDKDLMEGVADAAIVGSAMTGTIETAGEIALPSERRKASDLRTKQTQLFDALNNPDISEETKAGILKAMDNNENEIENLAKESKKTTDNLSSSQKTQVEGLNGQISELETVINDPNVSDDVKSQIEAQIKPLEKQIDDIVSNSEVTEPKDFYSSINETFKESKNDLEGFDKIIEMEGVKPMDDAQIESIRDDLSKKYNIPTYQEVYNQARSEAREGKGFFEKIKDAITEPNLITNATNTKFRENLENAIKNESNEQNKSTEVVSTPEETTTETVQKAVEPVVEESIAEKTSKEVISKAEDDLKALKQVENKTKKYEASVKRLTEAKNEKQITTQEFNDLKKRFDDVIGESKPKVKEETSNALQEQSTSSVLQHPQEGIGETGSKRGRVEPGIEGNETTSTQKQISGTEEVSVNAQEEKVNKAGDPLRAFATKVREGKINKLGGFKAATGFDGAWDLGLEAVALSLEGGAKVADAIQSGLQRIKETDWYKSLPDKENFDKQYNSHMKNEYDVVEEEYAGISHARNKEARKELGIEEYDKPESSTNEARRERAQEVISEGYDVNNLIKKIADDDKFVPNRDDIEILKQYNASLVGAINKNPTPELLKDRAELIRSIDLGTSRLGAGLQAVQGLEVAEDNLANFLFDEAQVFGVESLPSKDVEELTTKYEAAKSAKKAYDEGYAKAVEEYQKQNSENALGKDKAKARKTVPGEKKDYLAERKSIRESISKKWKAASAQANAVPVPYLVQLVEISPDVAKLVYSYVEEGVTNLNDIIKNVHGDLEQDIPEITETDVRDLIAGVYNKKQPTKRELLAELRDIQIQAKLMKKLDDLENGTYKDNSTVARVLRGKEIENLRKEIRDIEDRIGITDARGNISKRAMLDRKIAKLKEDIELGNFDLEPAAPRKIKLDKETQKKQDEYIKFLKETNVRRERARYDRQSKARKWWDNFQQVLGLRRLIQTSLDFSMPFRQSIVLALNPRHYGIGTKNITSLKGLLNTPHDIANSTAVTSWANMFTSAFSEKKYDRLMDAIRNDPDYHDMVQDKLVFSEVDSNDNLKRDEDFRTSFVYQIPLIKDALMASNRAAAGFQNTARFMMYKAMKNRLQDQGITHDNSPKSYEAAAKWAMNATGRGNMPEFVEKSPEIQRLLGNTFYGARLMASRFNLLNPNYYAKMPKEVRVEAMKDMLGFVGTFAATAVALSAAGAKVSLDPDDADFLKARFGNKRYDIAGGMGQYMRTAIRLIKAAVIRGNYELMHRGDKKEQRKATKYGTFALRSGVDFFRYKLAPNTGYAISAITGKDAVGKEFDPTELVEFYPMYTEDIITAYKSEDPAANFAATFFPNLFGIGVQDYEKKKTSEKQ